MNWLGPWRLDRKRRVWKREYAVRFSPTTSTASGTTPTLLAQEWYANQSVLGYTVHDVQVHLG